MNNEYLKLADQLIKSLNFGRRYFGMLGFIEDSVFLLALVLPTGTFLHAYVLIDVFTFVLHRPFRILFSVRLIILLIRLHFSTQLINFRFVITASENLNISFHFLLFFACNPSFSV